MKCPYCGGELKKYAYDGGLVVIFYCEYCNKKFEYNPAGGRIKEVSEE